MTSFAVLVILKATVVCGAALLLARVCRPVRASIRHLLFALAFAALIAIPVAAPFVPALTVMLPAEASPPVGARRPSDARVLPDSSGPQPQLSESSPVITARASGGWRPTIPQAFITLWLVGIALFLSPMLAGFWQVRRLRRTATLWIDGQALLQSLTSDLRVHRQIDVVLHGDVAGPLTCGVFRPSIILPATCPDWDEASLRRSLRHELHHVARWDLLTNCVSRMVCAAYWFHPLVWAAWRQLRLEAERTCDDAVVQDDDANDYAALLVAIAQRDPGGRRRPLLAMAGRDDLAARVAALLDDRQTRGRIGRRRAVVLTGAGTIAMLAVASITVARAMPQAPVTPAAPLLAIADASIKRHPPAEIRQFDGRITATSVTVRELLIAAYGVRDVENAPPWVRFDRFDIVATVPPESTPPRTRESTGMQALLIERFKLRAHRSTQDVPVYALVLARPDGRLGPQITPSQMDCTGQDSIRARALNGVVPTADASATPNCSTSSSAGRLAGGGVTLEDFAKSLPMHLRSYGSRQAFDRQIFDRTGLAGRFDFRLEWEQDVPVNSPSAPGRPFVSVLETIAPRFLAALQQQLGLKIESQMAPAPILVIDSIELPVEK